MSRLLSTYKEALRLPLARTAAAKRLPYFATGILSMTPMSVPGFGTFASTREGGLIHDPAIVAQLTANQCATELQHEYLHVFFDHAGRTDRLIKLGILQDTPGDRRLANWAADLELNDNLDATGCEWSPEKVIGKPLLPHSFGFEPHLRMEQYVALLIEWRKKNAMPPLAGRSCGSAAGNPLPNEPKLPASAIRTPEHQQLTRQHVAASIRAAGQGRGCPGNLLMYAEGLLQPPTVPWDVEFKGALSSAIAAEVAGHDDYSWTTRSRMQSAFDLIPGAPQFPGMAGYQPKVTLVIDTSGSMGGTFERGLSEVQGIMRTLGGARLTILAVDEEVHAMTEVRSVAEIRPHLRGGGGTSFVPPFTRLLALPKAKQPDVMVYYTDMCGDFPDRAPPWKTIWLAIGNPMTNAPFGKTIHISHNDFEARP